jgi:acyl-CoA synthetase (AMP-forming)/AMP-acid ligase II
MPFVVLTQQHLADRFSGGDRRIVCLHQEWADISREAPSPLTDKLAADQLAQIIYSVESPEPAGALMTHRALCHVAQAQIRYLQLTADGRIFQTHTLGVEMPVSGALLSLLAGATLCLGAAEVMHAKADFLALLRRWEVTAVLLPPVWLAQLPVAELNKLRIVISVGDLFPANVLEKWSIDERQCYNIYGSGAAAIYAIADRDRQINRPIIGRLAAGMYIYILDTYLNLVPVGAPGELYVGGKDLALGYHHAPGLTAGQFVPNPFCAEAGARLFKTGARVRYRADGTLELLGRADSPVIVRGRQVELGQIELLLNSHPAVQTAVVLAQKTAAEGRKGTDSHLVAYVVLHDGDAATIPVLRKFLKEKAPGYLLPSSFVLLEEMPLTPGAKIDRQALLLADTHRTLTDAPLQSPEQTSIENEISSRRDELAARQVQLSAAKQALLTKKLRGNSANRK